MIQKTQMSLFILFATFLLLLKEVKTGFLDSYTDISIPRGSSIGLSDVQGASMILGCREGQYSYFYSMNLETNALEYTNLSLNDTYLTSLSTHPLNTGSSGRMLLGQYFTYYFLNQSIPSSGTAMNNIGKLMLAHKFVTDDYSKILTVVTQDFQNSQIGFIENNVNDLNREQINDYLYTQILFPNQYIFLYGKHYQDRDSDLHIINSTDMKEFHSEIFALDANTRMKLCWDKIFVINLNSVFQLLITPPFTRTFLFNLTTNILSFACVADDILVFHTNYGAMHVYNATDGLEVESKNTSIFASKLHALNATSQMGFIQLFDTTIRIYEYAAPAALVVEDELEDQDQNDIEVEVEEIEIVEQPQETSNDNKTQFQEISQTTGTVLAMTSMKVSFKFAVPLSLFLEELWLYKFYKQASYPALMKTCMQEVDFMNLVKMKPKFLDSLSEKVHLGNSQKQNKKYSQIFNSTNKKGMGLEILAVYFFQATEQVFTIGVVINVSIFAVMVTIRILLYRIAKSKEDNFFWRDLYIGMKQRTRFWVLLCMILDSSFIRLCFSCFNQLTLAVFYDVESKINLIICVLFLFVLLCYSLFSYVLIRKYHVYSSENLLVYSFPTRKGFFIENLGFYFSRLLRAFCHSNFILVHSMKIKALISVDVIIISLYFMLRKDFFNKATFIVYIIYKLAFATMNLFVLFYWNQKTLLSMQRISEGIEYLIITLVGLTILQMFLGILRSIQQFYNDCKKNNQIQPAISKKDQNLTNQASLRKQSQFKSLNERKIKKYQHPKEPELNKKKNKTRKESQSPKCKTYISKNNRLKIKKTKGQKEDDVQLENQINSFQMKIVTFQEGKRKKLKKKNQEMLDLSRFVFPACNQEVQKHTSRKLKPKIFHHLQINQVNDIQG